MRKSLILVLLLPFVPLPAASSSLSIERQKRQVLNALNLASRPPHIYQTPSIPYSLRNWRNTDALGGVIEKVTLESQGRSWSCVTPEKVVDDCFQFSLDILYHEIHSADFVFNAKGKQNGSFILYEVDELFGELLYLDRKEIKEGDSDQINFEVSAHLQNWIKRRQRVKMLKIEFQSSNYSTQPLHNLLVSTPTFEVTIFRSTVYENGNSECNGCCIVPFYVNFTEIGWDDWILSPPGFYANFCSGGCSVDDDETFKFMKRSVEFNSIFPKPTCAPNHYGSVDFIVALGPRDIRKTRVHGMRALSCSCT